MSSNSIVYLHRYSPELESRMYAAMPGIMQKLSELYCARYCCSATPVKENADLRSCMEVHEWPFSINQFNKRDKWIKTILYYLYIPWILLKLKRLHPACIICKETLPLIPALVSLLKIPMVITTSDWWWSILFGGTRAGRYLADKLESLEVHCWNRPHVHIIASSRAEADLVVHRGFDLSRITIINHPVPPHLFYPCDAGDVLSEHGVKGENWTVAIHGIIRPGKGYRQLLEWWQKIAQIHSDWRLLIIGGGDGDRWCAGEIQRLGLAGRAIMTGWLPSHDDVNRFLNAADALLVCRRNSVDNQGVITSALYHSLATGRPTVATGLPGFAEVIRDRIDGFLFEPDSYESFCSTLEYVHDHPDEAAAVGAAGHQRAAVCFNLQQTESDFLKVVNGVIGEPA